MAIQSSITVSDIKRDLKHINSLNPSLRREITKDFRAIMQPVISDARGNIPGTAPLSGFNRKWRHIFPWNKAMANTGINVKIDTRNAENETSKKACNTSRWELSSWSRKIQLASYSTWLVAVEDHGIIRSETVIRILGVTR
jgi:hypothetical protein